MRVPVLTGVACSGHLVRDDLRVGRIAGHRPVPRHGARAWSALWTQPATRMGLVCALCAVGVRCTHSRMLPLLIITIGVSGVLTSSRRLERRQGAIVVATIIAGFAAVTWYSQYIVSRVWNDPVEGNSYVGVASSPSRVSTGVSAPADVVPVGQRGQGWPASDHRPCRVPPLRRVQADSDTRRVSDRARHSARSRALVGAVHVRPPVCRPHRLRAVQDAMIGPVVLIGLGSLMTRRTASAAVKRLGVIAVAIVALGVTLYATSRARARQ